MQQFTSFEEAVKLLESATAVLVDDSYVGFVEIYGRGVSEEYFELDYHYDGDHTSKLFKKDDNSSIEVGEDGSMGFADSENGDIWWLHVLQIAKVSTMTLVTKPKPLTANKLSYT